jgi:hypothetical protein
MIEALDSLDAPGEDLEENDQGGDEHDGAEPDVDDEPSLGSFNRMVNQERSYRQRQGRSFFYDDAEHDPADSREGDDEREGDPAEQSGIGDNDGLDEQTRETSSLWHFE